MLLNSGFLLFHAAARTSQEPLLPRGPVGEGHLLAAGWAGKPGGEGCDETVEDPLGETERFPDLVDALPRLPVETIRLLVESVLVGLLAGHDSSSLPIP
jgi:hypothetical protein